MREKKRRDRKSSKSDADESTIESQSSEQTESSRRRDGIQRTPSEQPPVTQPAPTYPPSAHPAPATPEPATPEPATPDPATVPGGVAVPSPSERARRKRERNIQRSIEGTDTSRDEVTDQVLEVIGSGGMPLDFSLQRALEERMDADFSDVRIHTGANAAEAADAIDAKAFTCGNDIVFNDGEYDPESPEGQHLLAHELAHVKQQTGTAISMMPQEGADLEIDPDPQLEREADEAAQEAMSGEEPLVVNRMGTDVHIQRKDWNAGPSNVECLSTGEGPGFVAGKVGDLTTKTYRLTQDELVDLVEKVDTPDELPAYIDENDVDASSRLQDTMGSGFKGATTGWKVGSMTGSVAGPVVAAGAGLAAMPIGYVFATQFGDTTADEIQNRLRDLLDLNTDQEFETDEAKDDESWKDKLTGW